MDAFINFEIPDGAWEPTGSEDDKCSRLLAHAKFNGTDFHVEAYAVQEKDGEGQDIVDQSFAPEWEAICALQSDGGAFRTTTMRNREYVIVMTPFLT